MKITVKLPDKVGDALNAQSDPNAFVVEAIQRALDLDLWQKEQISRGMVAAERREFVPDEQVNAFYDRWGVEEQDNE